MALVDGRARPSAPATGGAGNASVSQLLDRLSLARRGDAHASVLARLAAGTPASALSAGDWQTLATAWATRPDQRAQLGIRLQAAGIRLEASGSNRYVAFVTDSLRVTAEPASNRLRHTAGGLTRCYEGEALVRTIRPDGNRVEVTDAYGTTVWDAHSGQGLRDGEALRPRMARRQPNERARSPWASPLANDLVEPPWSKNTSMISYGPAYDVAVREAGGRVLEPTAAARPAADQYNCHAFAVTGAQGDLFDPFMRESHPHWLNNPMHRLLSGDFARLADDQRVRPGDVIVYRKGDKVTHTGVVRAVDRDGNPSLIESKYGTLGRYLHEPFDVPAIYGAPAEFFRPQAG